MLAAREAGHKNSEDFWRITMDRFLDTFANGLAENGAAQSTPSE